MSLRSYPYSLQPRFHFAYEEIVEKNDSEKIRKKFRYGPRSYMWSVTCVSFNSARAMTEIDCLNRLNSTLLRSAVLLTMGTGYFFSFPINQSNDQSINQSIDQSIDQNVYNESLGLIDWFNPPLEKLSQGDDFRVGPKSDRTPQDNTLISKMRANQTSRRLDRLCHSFLRKK